MYLSLLPGGVGKGGGPLSRAAACPRTRATLLWELTVGDSEGEMVEKQERRMFRRMECDVKSVCVCVCVCFALVGLLAALARTTLNEWLRPRNTK